MVYIVETERLKLRQFVFDDVEFIITLLNTPGWLRYIGDRNVRTPEQARGYLENGPLKSYELHGYGLYLVEMKDGHPIGMCGILNRDTLDRPDIGFAFLPEFCGKGYAFEIAKATVDYAGDKLGIKKIAAITVPGNARSIRLLEKIGLTFVRPFKLPGSSEDLRLYGN